MATHRKKKPITHTYHDFTWSEEEMDPRMFFDRFGHQMPLLVLVVQGYLGKDEGICAVAADEMYYVEGITEQLRLVVKDDKEHYYSVPYHYREKVTPSTSAGVDGPQMTMKEMCDSMDSSNYRFLKFDRKIGHRICQGADEVDYCTLGILEIVDTYNERFLVGHTILTCPSEYPEVRGYPRRRGIIQEGLYPYSVLIPIYLPISLAIAVSMARDPERKFHKTMYKFKKYIDGELQYHDHVLKDESDIMIFDQKPAEGDYDYIHFLNFIRSNKADDNITGDGYWQINDRKVKPDATEPPEPPPKRKTEVTKQGPLSTIKNVFKKDKPKQSRKRAPPALPPVDGPPVIPERKPIADMSESIKEKRRLEAIEKCKVFAELKPVALTERIGPVAVDTDIYDAVRRLNDALNEDSPSEDDESDYEDVGDLCPPSIPGPALLPRAPLPPRAKRTNTREKTFIPQPTQTPPDGENMKQTDVASEHRMSNTPQVNPRDLIDAKARLRSSSHLSARSEDKSVCMDQKSTESTAVIQRKATSGEHRAPKHLQQRNPADPVPVRGPTPHANAAHSAACNLDKTPLRAKDGSSNSAKAVTLPQQTPSTDQQGIVTSSETTNQGTGTISERIHRLKNDRASSKPKQPSTGSYSKGTGPRGVPPSVKPKPQTAPTERSRTNDGNAPRGLPHPVTNKPPMPQNTMPPDRTSPSKPEHVQSIDIKRENQPITLPSGKPHKVVGMVKPHPKSIIEDTHDGPKKQICDNSDKSRVKKQPYDVGDTLLKPGRFDPTNVQSLSEVPTDISQLTVSDVGKCLELLGLSEHKDKFSTETIDGCMVGMLGKGVLTTDFGFSEFKATKLLQFVNGWRPKT